MHVSDTGWLMCGSWQITMVPAFKQPNLLHPSSDTPSTRLRVWTTPRQILRPCSSPWNQTLWGWSWESTSDEVSPRWHRHQDAGTPEGRMRGLDKQAMLTQRKLSLWIVEVTREGFLEEVTFWDETWRVSRSEQTERKGKETQQGRRQSLALGNSQSGRG